MPNIENITRKFCRQTAVYWPPLGRANEEGKEILGDPIELAPPRNGVRWEQVTEDVQTPTGRTYTVKSEVLLLQDVEEGGLLWLGKLADWTKLEPPTEGEGGYEIISTEKIPAPDAKSFYRTATVGIRRA
jgi:hypothetical protein